MKPNDVGLLVAWKGQSSDLLWIFCLTKTQEYKLDMPTQIQYFMDPCYVIEHYTRCPLNPLRTKIGSTAMGNIYKYLFGQELANAHNSLVDAKAQTKIILHKTFLPFMNEQYSIKLLDDVWNRKVQAQAKVASEPTRPVPEPWKADEEMETWNLPPQFQYNGPPPGAKSKVKTAIRGKDDFEALKELWLLIYNREIMQFVAKETMRYAYDDWVLPTDRPNRDGNASKRKYWKHVPVYVDGARHRIDESIVTKDKRWDVTVGFLTAWHGLLLYSGAK
jgi:hypothetical protein